jgi:hypothetical protein
LKQKRVTRHASGQLVSIDKPVQKPVLKILKRNNKNKGIKMMACGQRVIGDFPTHNGITKRNAKKSKSRIQIIWLT